ncbi:MAG: PSD1 and planctomycete cytochrome C domain-containing protein [Verrucomicrobiaceae bacterium]|nr:PSD1 and planctomycete cytochrome C domain-containing protein [Verrucomicrobiaceae bacterium]
MQRVPLLVFLMTAAAPASRAELSFNRDIRPILSDNCFYCHGPDKNRRKAELRLDVREEALAKKAFEPGKPDASELIKRLFTRDEDDVMPPPDSHKTLSAKQKDTLKQWIAEGAKYEMHWAFIPLRLAEVPRNGALQAPTAVENHRSLNAIDYFIRERLAQEGLKPSPEASKETLIRRVTLDLTGLPPTIAEVDAFLADTSPQAYERVVDRLLKSPHYGERMAIDWLDAARYADSNGYQVDRDRELWPWRDWVIKAFNANMPFDEFTIEQIAGDLLPNATADQKIATGFHRNHMLNEEGGVLADEFLAEYTADRVETTAAVWLGQTFSCARCHDHKFDPFTQRDYYSMKAFFHNVSEKGVGAYGSPIRINAPPFLRLPTAEQTTKLAALETGIAAANKQLASSKTESASAVEGWIKRLTAEPVAWTPAKIANAKPAKATVEMKGDGAVVEPTRTGGSFTLACSIPISTGRATAIRLECANAAMSGSARWLDVSATLDKKPVKLRAAENAGSLAAAELKKTLDGARQTFVGVGPTEKRAVTGVFELVEPIKSDKPLELQLTVECGQASGPMLWSVSTTESDAELLVPASIAALAKLQKRTPAQTKRLTEFHAEQSPALRALDDKITSLTQQRDATEREVQTSLVMDEMKDPRSTFILMRGAYDKPGEQVTAATPAVLPAMDRSLPKNRLGLAKWLVSPQNPLTPRVIVNRLWQQVFGAGLVKTSEDFGSQGALPSHPELLDRLASEFIRSGWDVKHLVKLMVTSATYRQSSEFSVQGSQLDPENRLLWHGPRFRLMGEIVRDQALAASGLLRDQIGGPSVKPYHPPGLYEQVVAGSSAGTYVQGKGDDLRRRSLYTYWKRSVPNPAMLLFDAPFRETCTLRRPRTNTPLQALNVMNDPTYVEAARFLAQRMLHEISGSVDSRIEHGFKLLFARKPSAKEIAVLRASFERAQADFAKDKEAAKSLLAVGEAGLDAKLDVVELAAFTTVAGTLLNLDETVTKE